MRIESEAMQLNTYVHVFESIPMGLMVLDLGGYILNMNKYAKSIFNITGKINHGKHINTLLKDQVLPIDDILHTPEYGNTNSIKTKHKDKTLEIMGGPLNYGNGDLLGVVIILKDITETEKNHALERTREKYTVMGELSSDMAHEIRNPLGSIELLASLLKKELKRKKDINRVNQIIAAVKTMENKISQLIHLSKTKQVPAMHVNIHNVLKDILFFSEKIIDDGIVILSVQYADIEPIVECNADMMKQVFLNLILNALRESSRLDIVTRYLEERQMIEISFIEKRESTPDGVYSNIATRIPRIKEKNWGLGLAIVHNIVNMYKGYMKVECLVDIGTAFVLSFPLVKMEK